MAPGRDQRGMTLLVVIVAVAVLTALATQLSYTAYVRLQLAADARDELRAAWLARSGVATSRLVLAFQQQIDASMGGGPRPGLPTGAGGAAGGAGVAGALGALTGGAGLNLRIWSLVPISSGLVTGLFGGGPGPEVAPPPEGTPRAVPVARFGDFDGAFEANIEDEGAKVNAQLDALGTSGRLGPQVVALYQLVCDPRWDPLFDREDSRGQRTSRQDLIVFLRDWVDDDAVTSALAASFPAACQALVPDNPFEQGFGDENLPYDRGASDERYKTKNARLDSLDELFLVQGYTDLVGSAFGDRLTVYLPRESKRTIDARNASTLVELAMSVADPPGQAVLFTPEFRTRLQQAVMEQTLGGLLGISSASFVATLTALGVQVSATAANPSSPKNYLADRSYVYRIRSAGSAGTVTSTLDVVVTYDPNQNRGEGTVGVAQEGTSAGRVLRWREE